MESRKRLRKEYAQPVYRRSMIALFEKQANSYTECGSSVLMEKAGNALHTFAQERYPDVDHYHIVCGRGNNGGDGLVLARMAADTGTAVTVYLVDDPTANDAIAAYRKMLQSNGTTNKLADFSPTSGLIIDCLLGTGLSRAPEGIAHDYITKINASNVPVLSADIPSGLDADTGNAPGSVVSANSTLTFIGPKPGLLTGQGRSVSGDVVVDCLGVETDAAETRLFAMNSAMVKQGLHTRPVDSHKGMFGHVLVIGGDQGYGGAALLAGGAALRSGAGLVSIITHPHHHVALLSVRPELMVNGFSSVADNNDRIDVLLEQADVVVLGPGLGQGSFGQSFFSYVMGYLKSSHKAAVIDADALNLLSNSQLTLNKSTIITPHPGEAARLLSCNTRDISADRFSTAKKLYDKYKSVVVLKGAGSLVCDGDLTLICDTGNAGMASGGMGDVLSGIIGTMLAQQYDAMDAAAVSVWLHGRAGDVVAQQGQVGMLASDLIDTLPRVVNASSLVDSPECAQTRRHLA